MHDMTIEETGKPVLPRIIRPSASYDNHLATVEFQGELFACGKAYGELNANLIFAFLAQETLPNPERLELAKSCLPYIERFTPKSSEFLRGMQVGSGITLEELILLNLHEEIYHENEAEDGHCTAFLVSSDESPDSKTLVAQNWDWTPSQYPFASLLKIKSPDMPHLLTYSYPGLWAGCGINSEGLAHMWTGSGYFPTVLPTPGVPSYMLISELLMKKDVEEAIQFLQTTPNAGAYIFLLADKSGKTAIIEAMPGGLMDIDYAPKNIRSNQYELNKLISASSQKIPYRHSVELRRDQASAFLQNREFSLEEIKLALSIAPIYRGFGEEKYLRCTEDSLIADCNDCALWTRRGGFKMGDWIRTQVL